MATDDQPTNGTPELTPEQISQIRAYSFGTRFATTGRPAELKIPADIAMHELIDLAFWILRPDNGLRQAIEDFEAANPATAIELVQRPPLMVVRRGKVDA